MREIEKMTNDDCYEPPSVIDLGSLARLTQAASPSGKSNDGTAANVLKS